MLSPLILSGSAGTRLWPVSRESTFIRAGHQRRFENPGLLELVMIEMQSGNYVRQNQNGIVWFESVYGRAKGAA